MTELKKLTDRETDEYNLTIAKLEIDGAIKKLEFLRGDYPEIFNDVHGNLTEALTLVDKRLDSLKNSKN